MKKTKAIKSDKIVNLYHPKVSGKIEKAFIAGGIQYYNFKQDSEGLYGRYIVMQAFLQEYHLRVDLATLKANIAQLMAWMNPVAGQAIQLGKCHELLDIMRQRAEIAFEPDTVYRLASCLYFDDQEVLSGYDKPHNDIKIARWKEDNTTDFFFHKLFQELTRLTVSSKDDLVSYLAQVPELLKGWHQMEDILRL